ncbi:hypothetical protein AAFF_G00115730 [Aldrovandia affinis]|uniref:Tubulin--tyrosine ligase-like protein 9 n=1 Tax=Aldrovandia affinis TaxID=143900 RepID=A0AAD7VXR3_9TELE|nr:hypothetical protein AAFF_G00115730 [Aldrovandia affinis]
MYNCSQKRRIQGCLRQREKEGGEGRGYVRYKCPPHQDAAGRAEAAAGLAGGAGREWDFHWCGVGWLRENYGHAYLEDHVRICHFGNHYELTRKNLMVKNLKRQRWHLEREASPAEAARCDFFPCTFELPCEYHLFGRGIFLFRRLKGVTDWRRGARPGGRAARRGGARESYVAQRYIEDPYLISGRKFDLRVYVLVTSYRPLKAWLYRGRPARFSGTRFSLGSIRDQYAHLTNVAVQCTAPDYDPERGCKWQLQQLRRYLTARHGARAVEALFGEIDNVFVRSLQSVQKVIINDKHCFELYGYDIILDKGLKPWLIEVNASPSLNATCQQDYELKCRLLEDTLNVVDMEGRLTGREAQVGGFDLMWSDGPVYREA